MDDLTPGPIDPILRFVNVTWLWIVIEIVQLVFVDQIWFRFIGEYPESQFLDMCVIAKISVFILDERYHGYYMHCRSPHEHADANMVEIDKNLAKMRDNLVVTDLSGEHAKVQAVANAVWTDDVKTTWKNKLIADKS